MRLEVQLRPDGEDVGEELGPGLARAAVPDVPPEDAIGDADREAVRHHVLASELRVRAVVRRVEAARAQRSPVFLPLLDAAGDEAPTGGSNDLRREHCMAA